MPAVTTVHFNLSTTLHFDNQTVLAYSTAAKIDPKVETEKKLENNRKKAAKFAEKKAKSKTLLRDTEYELCLISCLLVLSTRMIGEVLRIDFPAKTSYTVFNSNLYWINSP